MITGWREIAKMCGYYAPERKQIELRDGHDVLWAQLEAMSDAQLLELCAFPISDVLPRSAYNP